MPCVTDGNPAPEITWTKEGDSEALDVQDRFRVLENGSLVIEQPNADDSGSYTCTAKNPAGMDTYEVAVEVYSKFPIFS